MIKQLAPYLSKNLSNKKIDYIDNLLDSLNNNKLIQQKKIPYFTDHGLQHCKNIIRIIDLFLEQQNYDLNEDEVYIILISCYLHDIGLIITPSKVSDYCDWYKSNEFDYDWIINTHNLKTCKYCWGSYKQVNLESSLDLPVEPQITEIIIEVCSGHKNTKNILDLTTQHCVNNVVIRTRLLAALLRLGEILEVESSRLNLKVFENIPNLANRLLWYRYSCIKELLIETPKVTITFIVPLGVSRPDFNEVILDPMQIYFQTALGKLAPIFREYEVVCLELLYKIESGVLPGDLDEKDSLLLTAALIKAAIRSRSKKRQREIDEKIVKNGLISRGLINNELIVLRRWSSYTPRMPSWNLREEKSDGVNLSKGGGFFLVWGNKGIVIDPGYDFLKNFWTLDAHEGEHFELDDINGIICSHAHDDHTHDFEPIVSLLYKRRKKIGTKEDVYLYCSEGVHIKYERLLSLNSFIKVMDLVPREGEQFIFDDSWLSSNGIKLEYLRTDHNERPWLLNNTGIAIKIILDNEFGNIIIGYTSDTKYFMGLSEFFSKADVVLMNFGNMGPDNDETSYDDNHLGFNGCHDLINNLKNDCPKLFLIDEFGEEEIGNDRIKICELLENLTEVRKEGKRVLPMDIGLRIKLPDLKIFCDETKEFVPYMQIVPHLINKLEGITYISRR